MDIGCAVSRAKMTAVYGSHPVVHVLHSVQGCNFVGCNEIASACAALSIGARLVLWDWILAVQ